MTMTMMVIIVTIVIMIIIVIMIMMFVMVMVITWILKGLLLPVVGVAGVVGNAISLVVIHKVSRSRTNLNC